MTHFKKHWMLLLANRLKEQKRIVIKKDLYPQFLCYAIKPENLGASFMITVHTTPENNIMIFPQ